MTDKTLLPIIDGIVNKATAENLSDALTKNAPNAEELYVFALQYLYNHLDEALEEAERKREKIKP